MKIEDIRAGDVLVNTDGNDTGYVKVLKVCKVRIRVRGENGNEFLSWPSLYERKVIYPVKAFEGTS